MPTPTKPQSSNPLTSATKYAARMELRRQVRKRVGTSLIADILITIANHLLRKVK